ncbi:EpsG family protein [Aeromonas veronii]
MYNSFFRVILLYAIYIPACAWYSYNQALIGDVKNYYDVYQQIGYEPYPFGSEVFLPLLMSLANYCGLSYYDFTFFRLLLWGWVILSWSDNLKKKGVLVVCIFFVSFCIPPFLNSMIFLARQSLSLFFCFLAMQFRSRIVKSIFVICMLFSHFGSVFWLLAILGVGVGFVNSRKFIFSIICILTINVFLKTDAASLLIHFLTSDILPIPSIIKDIYSAKLGFYLYDQGEIKTTLSLYSTMIIFISLLILYVSIDKVRSVFCGKVIYLYLLSSMFLALFYSNDVLANRLGMASYFMVIPFFVFFIFDALRVNYDKNRYPISNI